jgi:hypothetical protein
MLWGVTLCSKYRYAKNYMILDYVLEWPMAKQFASVGLNLVLWCINLTLVPTGSHMNKQVQVVLVNELQPTHQLDNIGCKSTQT